MDLEFDVSTSEDIKPMVRQKDEGMNSAGLGARNRALRMVREDSSNLASLPLLFQNDKEIVQLAVEKLGYTLKHASDELRADRETVLLACKNWPHAIKFASNELKDNQSFMLSVVALKGGGVALQYGSDNMIADKSVVYAAIKSYGGALKFASEELREDSTFLLSCAQGNPSSIRGAAEVIQEHPEHSEIWMTIIETAGEQHDKNEKEDLAAKNNNGNLSSPTMLMVDALNEHSDQESEHNSENEDDDESDFDDVED